MFLNAHPVFAADYTSNTRAITALQVVHSLVQGFRDGTAPMGP